MRDAPVHSEEWRESVSVRGIGEGVEGGGKEEKEEERGMVWR